MSVIINSGNCSSTGNLAGGGCTFNPGLVKGAILAPMGTVLTMTQLAALKASLQTNLTTNSRTARSFLIGTLGKLKDQFVAEKTEDMDGYNQTVFEGNYEMMWQLITGGKCQHQTLIGGFNFSQGQYDCYLFDDQNNLWGWNNPDASGNLQLQGFSLFEINVMAWRIKTISTANNYPIKFAFLDRAQFNKNFVSVAMGFNPLAYGSLKGVQDATLTGTGSAGSFIVAGTINCGNTSLGATYNSTLAAAGAWVATDSSGAALTITAVTYSAATNNYTLTITGGTTGDTISISLASISVMAAAPFNIKYIASETPASVTW